MKKQIFTLVLLGLVCSVGNVWGTLTAHTPGTYEKSVATGGYGIDLTTYSGNQYEVYYFSANSQYGTTCNVYGGGEKAQYRLMAADENSEYILLCNSSDGTKDTEWNESCDWIETDFGTSGFAKSDYTYGTNTFSEFFAITPNGGNASYTKTCLIKPKAGDSFTLKVSGYTEFAILSKDNSSSKYITVSVDGGENSLEKNSSDDPSRRGVSLTTGEHTIVVACVGSSANKIYGFSLKVATAPSFTAPTVDQSASYEVNETPSALSVTAIGNPAPTLQWYSNTVASTSGANVTELTNQTNSTYTPSTTEKSDLYFYCVATNSLGTATSPFFHVAVTDPICPSGISISGIKEYYVGGTIELTATLEAGNGSISYQWYKDGLEDANKLDEETSSTLSISPCTLGDAGSYYCVASKYGCLADAESAAFPISVIAVPSGNRQLFSIQFVNDAEVKMDAGETIDLTASEATIVGGSASISYFNGTNTGKTVINSSKKMNYDTNNMYLKLALDEELQPGDAIKIFDGTGNQIAIANTAGSPTAPASASSSNKVTTSSYMYFVTAEDAIDGKTALYLGRATSGSTTHGKVTITRPYTRSVTSGNWGTICLPYAVTASDYDGATFYSIAGKRVNGSGDPTSIVLTEETGALVAGRPYIFQASKGTVSAVYSGDVASAGSYNGLIGSIGGTSVDPGMYLLSSGTIVKAGTGCSIAANRAYINMASVPVYDGGGSAPGIREIPMAPTTPTSVENVNSAEKAVKFVENGQILILRDGITYDIMGRVIR